MPKKGYKLTKEDKEKMSRLRRNGLKLRTCGIRIGIGP